MYMFAKSLEANEAKRSLNIGDEFKEVSLKIYSLIFLCTSCFEAVGLLPFSDKGLLQPNMIKKM